MSAEVASRYLLLAASHVFSLGHMLEEKKNLLVLKKASVTMAAQNYEHRGTGGEEKVSDSKGDI